MSLSIRKVHVVYKTHLDIGFTDLSHNVTQHYLNSFIPRAIELAQALNTPDEKKFIWTVGSWLIHEALASYPAEKKQALVEAIERGDIVWHGLPFTTHTELMDEALFSHALTMSQRLDRQFGRTTVAAKMTDVPGHTRGIIAPMARAGLKYLHLGVNDVSRRPSVPDLFVWADDEGNELLVNYAQGYGNATVLDGFDEVLHFVHSNDNEGPPRAQQVHAAFEKLKNQYPHAEITASTLDDYAQALLLHKHKLPRITSEIGDTWIHGAGTDPYKVSAFLSLCRLAAQWRGQTAADDAKKSAELDAFCDALLMVPEHTWGLDVKKYMNDYTHWRKQDFAKARAQDALPDVYAQVEGYLDALEVAKREYMAMNPPMPWKERTYALFESSHQEQREYLIKAVSTLSGAWREAAQQALENSRTMALPRVLQQWGSGAKEIHADTPVQIGKYAVHLQADGSIAVEGLLPDAAAVLGRFSYELFGLETYLNFKRDYMHEFEKNQIWGKIDYFKPGMENLEPVPHNQLALPQLEQAYLHGNQLLIEMRFEHALCEQYGAPRQVLIGYTFDEKGISVEANLTGKDANRLPEALWLSFAEGLEYGDLRLKKLGQWVDPADVVEGGNDRYHVVEATQFTQNGVRLQIVPLDTPLVSPGQRRLYNFSPGEGDIGQGLHFNLYNNLWGTNFKMWYEEDLLARFIIQAK